MRFLVTWEVFDTLIGEAVPPLRQKVGEQIQQIMSSGKVVASGILVEKRGGFFVVDADSAVELEELLGPTLHDTCHMRIQPVLPVEQLAELFRKWGNQ